jgi:hypothetical protein
MKNVRKLLVFMMVIFGITVFNSCNKNEIETEKLVLKTENSDYLGMVDIFSLATEEEITSGENDGLKSAELLSCLTVTIHENENNEFWPRSWTLDYGTENCECFSGNTKRGKINVTLSDWWRNEGSFREITFEDFYMNDNKLEGVKTILNTGKNESGNLTFTKKVTNAKLTNTDGLSISWNCEKQSEQIEGGTTILFADDVWSVTGTGVGVNLDEKQFTMKITSALIYKNGCFYPLSGTVEIVTDGEPLKIIDYGTGDCDNIASVTTGEVTEIIEL